MSTWPLSASSSGVDVDRMSASMKVALEVVAVAVAEEVVADIKVAADVDAVQVVRGRAVVDQPAEVVADEGADVYQDCAVLPAFQDLGVGEQPA